MNPDTIAAIERKDREILVAGNDMKEAIERIVASDGQVEATERTDRNSIWKFKIFYANNPDS